MKRHSHTFPSVALIIVVILMGACNDNVWDDVPTPIQDFITKYFPFGEVKSYTETDNEIRTVSVDNGVTIVFNESYNWISVNGNGVPLPQMFLYDELPTILYNYLFEMEQTNSVYAVSRDATAINVELHDTLVSYDIQTGEITYPSSPSKT